MDLSKLAEPFPLEDIEWRVNRSGKGHDGKTYCYVLAYITARAIQTRLDGVCGPENWRLEEPRILTVNGTSTFACGISIRCDSEWVTKWDVSEPTKVSNIDSSKGGWSGAMKRAGSQWGVGRYLYRLTETFAEVSDKKEKRWNYAKLPKEHGSGIFYWKSPGLPAFALPKDPEHEVSVAELKELKQAWRKKFAPDCRDPKELREGLARFVHSIAGEFPVSDHTCWTQDALAKCKERIEATDDPSGIDSDVDFGAGGGKEE